MAKFTPQSLNRMIIIGAVMAMEYRPKFAGPRSPATTIVPTDEMTVEAISPHMTWKLSLNEVLAMPTALFILFLPEIRLI